MGAGQAGPQARKPRLESRVSGARRARAPDAHASNLPGHRTAPGDIAVELTWYPAPAKLNLFLHILDRRTDGYHELQTVFRLIDRSDRIGVAPRRDGKVLFDGPFGEDDLCVRAAKLIGKGCELALEKNIPVGGGLGGGSSDAATVLLVLNRIH